LTQTDNSRWICGALGFGLGPG